MNPVNYYINGITKKYAKFEGRASRAEFWYFILFTLIITAICDVINQRLEQVYSIAALVPTIAVAIRRMHDINKSGWFILIPIYNLILYCQAGDIGDNQYGADPKPS